MIFSEMSNGASEEAVNIRLWAEYLATEAIRECFPVGLPHLLRTLLWTEQCLTFEGGPAGTLAGELPILPSLACRPESR